MNVPQALVQTYEGIEGRPNQACILDKSATRKVKEHYAFISLGPKANFHQ